jgi:hypothetical protein
LKLPVRALLCAAVLSTSLVMPALAAPASSSTPSASARIRYVAGNAAYLDRGGRDGVVVGSAIPIVQRGRTMGTCTIDAVADHTARCAFPDVKSLAGRPGDRVAYQRTDPVDEPHPEPPQLLPDDAIEAARATVSAVAQDKVVYAKSRKRAGVAIANRLDLGVRARGWTVIGSDSTFVRPSVDVGVRGALPFVTGLYAQSALRVQGDVLAPGGERFRNSVPAEVYVWDASLGLNAGRSGVTGAIGRFRPAKVPGMTVIDGALMGYVGFGGTVEVGAYGGFVPDLITTAPSFDRVTAGAYFGLDASPLPGLLLLPRARVGLLTSSDLQKTRAEVEAQLQTLWTNAVAVGGSLRLALPGDTAEVVVDAARIDVDMVPTDTLRVRLGWRTTGSQPGDLDTGIIADDTLVSPVRAAHHGDVAVVWSPSPVMSVGGNGGVAYDEDSGEYRAFVGPEFALPRLFGDSGGMSVGYLEEPGFLWGRSAFAQTTTRPLGELLPSLSWSTRLSYFEHQAAPSDKTVFGGALRETMLMTFVDAPLNSWLSVRGRAQGLFDIVDLDGFGAVPVGVFLDIGLTGSL